MIASLATFYFTRRRICLRAVYVRVAHGRSLSRANSIRRRNRIIDTPPRLYRSPLRPRNSTSKPRVLRRRSSLESSTAKYRASASAEHRGKKPHATRADEVRRRERLQRPLGSSKKAESIALSSEQRTTCTASVPCRNWIVGKLRRVKLRQKVSSKIEEIEENARLHYDKSRNLLYENNNRFIFWRESISSQKI